MLLQRTVNYSSANFLYRYLFIKFLIPAFSRRKGKRFSPKEFIFFKLFPMKLFFLFLLIPFFSLAQVTYTGIITDKNTHQSIPFATIGLIKENTGMNADENGTFVLLSANPKDKDSLWISSMGYEAGKVPVLNNQKEYNIELTPQTIPLHEVTVSEKTSNAFKTNTLNDFKKCGNSFITSNGYMSQIAQRFTILEENSILTSIKICRFNLGVLDKEPTRFRIRIYSVDENTGAPDKDLCNEIIEVKTGSKNVTVDLTEYYIRIFQKEFFVAIEWLKIPYNKDRSEVVINGKKKEHITYRPSIGWTDHPNDNAGTWFLDYKGSWQEIPEIFNRKKTTLSIAATITH